jgi:hypothetical protein
MEKKKSKSVRAVVEGHVTRAITKALEKLAWQVTEKHVSDNARIEMATGQEHVTATHFYHFLTR